MLTLCWKHFFIFNNLACGVGFYWDYTNCTVCPIGTYNDDEEAPELRCESCEPGFTTQQEGSTSSDQVYHALFLSGFHSLIFSYFSMRCWIFLVIEMEWEWNPRSKLYTLSHWNLQWWWRSTWGAVYFLWTRIHDSTRRKHQQRTMRTK